MLQSQSLVSNIFQGKSKSFVCNANKNLIGVLKGGMTKDVFNYQIFIFQFKKKNWGEYFKMKLQSNTDVYIVIILQNFTNIIEFVSVDQKMVLRVFTYLSGTIQCFFKFSTNICLYVEMTLSENKKMVLIETQPDYLLLDVIEEGEFLITKNFNLKRISLQFLKYLNENDLQIRQTKIRLSEIKIFLIILISLASPLIILEI